MQRKRVTLRVWLVFCVLHTLVTLVVVCLCLLVFGMFLKGTDTALLVSGLLVPLASGLAILTFFAAIGTPYWALVWSRVYVDRYNRRIPHYYCRKCGYNLTGNVSGVCSECGKAT